MMKAVVDGLRYDTEKAEKIGEASSWGKRADPQTGIWLDHGWDEVLYRTASGRFFLYGEGTEGTRWYRLTPVGQKGAIRPIEEDDARAWVERYCSAEVFEKVWPGAAKDA